MLMYGLVSSDDDDNEVDGDNLIYASGNQTGDVPLAFFLPGECSASEETILAQFAPHRFSCRCPPSLLSNICRF